MKYPKFADWAAAQGYVLEGATKEQREVWEKKYFHDGMAELCKESQKEIIRSSIRATAVTAVCVVGALLLAKKMMS